MLLQFDRQRATTNEQLKRSDILTTIKKSRLKDDEKETTNVQKRDPLFIDKHAFALFPVADPNSECVYSYFVLIFLPLFY